MLHRELWGVVLTRPSGISQGQRQRQKITKLRSKCFDKSKAQDLGQQEGRCLTWLRRPQGLRARISVCFGAGEGEADCLRKKIRMLDLPRPSPLASFLVEYPTSNLTA